MIIKFFFLEQFKTYPYYDRSNEDEVVWLDIILYIALAICRFIG